MLTSMREERDSTGEEEKRIKRILLALTRPGKATEWAVRFGSRNHRQVG